MGNGEIMGWVSLGVTLLLGIGLFLNSRRTNKTGEKKLTLEEQIAQDTNDDRIAERRLKELNRLYAQVDELVAAKDELTGRVAALESGREDDKDRIVLMERHIDAVEALVPNPPGPPPRPWRSGSG